VTVGETSTSAIATLIELSNSADHKIQIEAVRSLRGAADSKKVESALLEVMNRIEIVNVTPEDLELQAQLLLAWNAAKGTPPPHNGNGGLRPKTVDEWPALAAEAGDAESGRRVFFHAGGAGCYRCHTVNGRGGRIGPDLSTIARSMNRNKLAESIVDPSKEIAPQFVSFAFVTNDGKVHTGMILRDYRQGKIEIGTPEGTVIALDSNDIERPIPQKASLMPDKLTDRMTPREFRDLVAYLETLK
jgi:putative heme-binding domain-containing protein